MPRPSRRAAAAKKKDTRRALVLRAFELVNERLDPKEHFRPSRDEHEDEHRLAGTLTDFARDPARLHRLLDDVPDGPEVIRRLGRLVRAAGPGIDRRRGTFDVYLVVRRPEPIDREATALLVRKHYRAITRLAEELDEPELALALRAPVPVRWGRRPTPDEWQDGSVEGDIHEFLGDQFARRETSHPLHALHEAAYTLAASYEIERYVLWPAYAAGITTKDPYRHRAALWRHGLGTYHEGDRIRVWRETHR